MKFTELVQEGIASNIKGFDYKEIAKRLKNKEDFTVDLTKVEAYDIGGSNGYIVKYKGSMIFAEKKGILLDRIGYNKEVAELAKTISEVFNVEVKMKDYDDLDKAWLKIWGHDVNENGKQLKKWLISYGKNEYRVYGSYIILKKDGKSVDIMDDSLSDKVKKEILSISGADADDTINQVHAYMSTLGIKMVGEKVVNEAMSNTDIIRSAAKQIDAIIKDNDLLNPIQIAVRPAKKEFIISSRNTLVICKMTISGDKVELDPISATKMSPYAIV